MVKTLWIGAYNSYAPKSSDGKFKFLSSGVHNNTLKIVTPCNSSAITTLA